VSTERSAPQQDLERLGGAEATAAVVEHDCPLVDYSQRDRFLGSQRRSRPD
jgi:hypothetical protein